MSVNSERGKIKEICDLVLKETLEPAKEEANRTIEDAKKEASRIIDEARNKARQMEEETRTQFRKELEVHNAQIQLAISKGLAKLKELVTGIFSHEVEHLLSIGLANEDVVADLINALVSSIEKEGIRGNLRVLIPQKVSIPVVQGKILQTIRERLGSEGVRLGDFKGGVVLKILDKKMSIEVTEESVKELLGTYLDDLKERLFSK